MRFYVLMVIVASAAITKAQETEEIELEDTTEPPVINNYYCGQKGDKGEKGTAAEERECHCDLSAAVVNELIAEFQSEIQTLKDSLDRLMCPPPPPVDDPNVISDVTNKSMINTMVTYSCSNNLRIAGGTTRTCQSNLQWSEFDPKAPTCQSKCRDDELLIRGDCFFVGDRTIAYTTRTQANRVCQAQRPNSYLGFIKNKETYNKLKTYVEGYLQEQAGYYGTMYLALGGSYNPMRGGDTITWADGTSTPSPRWWPGFPRTVEDDADYKGYTFINMGISGNIDGLYNHFRHESGSKAHVLCQYTHGY